ncbi:MAG: galactokinase [Spirochaetia bacterium]
MDYRADAWIEKINQGGLDSVFIELYGKENIEAQRSRYVNTITEHRERYGDSEIRVFSTPGRTELGGNHTDHNLGKVIAGSVDLDAIAVVTLSPAEDQSIDIYSLDFKKEFSVSIEKTSPKEDEKGTTAALIRGVAAWFTEKGLPIKGFQASIQSNVFPGSGLSSSACFEVLICTIADYLHNKGSLSAIDRGLCGKYAENIFFGKPSGLMDQLACSIGGIAGINFQKPEEPEITTVSADFYSAGYQLCIIDTKSHHAASTDDYAAIPREMAMVAKALGVTHLGETTAETFWQRFPLLKNELSGRAVARAAHFFRENKRVEQMLSALQAKPNIPTYLQAVKESGNSSFKYLQNVIDDVENQDYALALLVTEAAPGAKDIVSRVHGGGFGGTIQAYVPVEHWNDFTAFMNEKIGHGCVIPITIRNSGSMEIAFPC